MNNTGSRSIVFSRAILGSKLPTRSGCSQLGCVAVPAASAALGRRAASSVRPPSAGKQKWAWPLDKLLPGHSDERPQRMQYQRASVDTVRYTDELLALCKAKRCGKWNAYDQVPELRAALHQDPEVELDSHLVTALARALAKSGDLAGAKAEVEDAVLVHGLDLSFHVRTVFVHELARTGRFDLAELWLYSTGQRRDPTYTRLIGTLSEADRALVPSPAVLRRTAPAAQCSYNALLAGLTRRNQFRRAWGLIDEMARGGMSPDAYTLTPMMFSYARTNMMSMSISVLKLMHSRNIELTVGTYSVSMMIYNRQRMYEQALAVADMWLSRTPSSDSDHGGDGGHHGAAADTDGRSNPGPTDEPAAEQQRARAPRARRLPLDKQPGHGDVAFYRQVLLAHMALGQFDGLARTLRLMDRDRVETAPALHYLLKQEDFVLGAPAPFLETVLARAQKAMDSDLVRAPTLEPTISCLWHRFSDQPATLSRLLSYLKTDED